MTHLAVRFVDIFPVFNCINESALFASPLALVERYIRFFNFFDDRLFFLNSLFWGSFLLSTWLNHDGFEVHVVHCHDNICELIILCSFVGITLGFLSTEQIGYRRLVFNQFWNIWRRRIYFDLFENLIKLAIVLVQIDFAADTEVVHLEDPIAFPAAPAGFERNTFVFLFRFKFRLDVIFSRFLLFDWLYFLSLATTIELQYIEVDLEFLFFNCFRWWSLFDLQRDLWFQNRRITSISFVDL